MGQKSRGCSTTRSHALVAVSTRKTSRGSGVLEEALRAPISGFWWATDPQVSSTPHTPGPLLHRQLEAGHGGVRCEEPPSSPVGPAVLTSSCTDARRQAGRPRQRQSRPPSRSVSVLVSSEKQARPGHSVASSLPLSAAKGNEWLSRESPVLGGGMTAAPPERHPSLPSLNTSQSVVI